VISGFRRGLNEIFAFLGCYTAYIVVIDVSGQPIGPIFNGQAEEDCLTLEDGTDRLSRNVGNY
jgi:hypothetical protein